MREAAIKAVVPYFGAKRELAARIVAEFGEHRAFFEIFCGSCAVLFAKDPCPMEYVCDLNGDLTNLIRVVADDDLSEKLFASTRRMLMSEAMFKEAAARWKKKGYNAVGGDHGQPDVAAAVDYLYTSWVGRNGTVGCRSYNQGFAARYTQGGGHGGTRWKNAVDSIPDWHDRLRGVVVLNRCSFALLDKIEDEFGTVIYLDPPYVEKGAKYIHDFQAADDDAVHKCCNGVHTHKRLAQSLRRFKKARVVVSYYDHELVRSLYERWTFVNCPVPKAMACGNMRGKRGPVDAPEILVINGPSKTSGGLFVWEGAK